MSTESLRCGMYVRVPFDLFGESEEFRDFFIGRIEHIDVVSDTLTVDFQHFDPSNETTFLRREFPSHYARRCKILPDTSFELLDTREQGMLLISCESSAVDSEYYQYYAQIGGAVQRVSEDRFIAPSHRGDPDPFEQFRNYEFHHPSFKFPRDRLVEAYAELKAATYGMEDLIGSRIRLLAHQADVVTKVLSDTKCRYLLADEVGLGKTIEACVILRGLRRRHPVLRSLILAPAALTAQWYRELDEKFWLRFATSISAFSNQRDVPGLIISTEDLTSDKKLALWLTKHEWDLLIVDEAHHLHRNQDLFHIIKRLSERSDRALILSATPIQRRAEELLTLLRLVDPERYDGMTSTEFKSSLRYQHNLIMLITAIVVDLTPDYFDAGSFVDDMEDILSLLQHDVQLTSMIENVKKPDSSSQHLEHAKEAVAYIAENYRLEKRILRNRRANLSIAMPERRADTNYSYDATQTEREALDEIYHYLEKCIEELGTEPHILEYVRLFLIASHSSPHTLEGLLDRRIYAVNRGITEDSSLLISLTMPRTLRDEQERFHKLVAAIPPLHDETVILSQLKWYISKWVTETDEGLGAISHRTVVPNLPNRIIQILRAVNELSNDTPGNDAKIVIFSTFVSTLELIRTQLRKHYGRRAIVEFHSEIPECELQNEVDRFQNEPECRFLLCDESGGEGRNFQIAQAIIHVDIPWTPTLLEQRIGRVDRLGREGAVLSVIPFTRDDVEYDLFSIWQDAFSIFTHSLSGMEIALEDVQNQLLTAISRSIRNGLYEITEEMRGLASELREQVEEERYYEQEATNKRKWEEFGSLSESYRNGNKLRIPVLYWAEQAGLNSRYDYRNDTVCYYPRKFNFSSMANAKFVNAPNMEQAMEYARNPANQTIEGTFNRSIAVEREDLVFFAPGTDPWTDAIIGNAIEADRGRSCGILRYSEEVVERWRGFELFYHIQVDPRMLYEHGYDPVHQWWARGYLMMSSVRLLVDLGGQILPTSHDLYKIIQKPFSKGSDIHLGTRSGANAPINAFKKVWPHARWSQVIDAIHRRSKAYLAKELVFTRDIAHEASDDFKQAAYGMRSSILWKQKAKIAEISEQIDYTYDYEQATTALVAGLKNPMIRLESICYWHIEPKT